MSVKYLITPSLLGAFACYLSDESENSREKFLQTLRRERTPTTEAQQKGLDFEDAINFYSQDRSNLSEEVNKLACSDVIFDIANIVKGGLWQQTCKKDLQVGNNTFLLYGRMDVVKRDTIYDIKYTSNYEVGLNQAFVNEVAETYVYLSKIRYKD